MGFPKFNGKLNGVPRLVYFKNAALISIGISVTGGLAGYVAHDLVHEDPSPLITKLTCVPNGKNFDCYVPIPNMASIDRVPDSQTTTTQLDVSSTTIPDRTSIESNDERPMWPIDEKAWIILGAASFVGIGSIAITGGFSDR